MVRLSVPASSLTLSLALRTQLAANTFFGNFEGDTTRTTSKERATDVVPGSAPAESNANGTALRRRRAPDESESASTEPDPGSSEAAESASRQKPKTWLEFLIGLIYGALRLPARALGLLWAFITSFFPGSLNETLSEEAAEAAGPLEAQLRTEYGSSPSMFDGPFQKALDKAKRDLKFLCIYLHDPSSKDTVRVS